MNKLILTAIIGALAACSSSSSDDDLVTEASAARDIDVENTMVRSDAGEIAVHTVYADDIVYTMEIAPAQDDRVFTTTWTVDDGEQIVRRSADFRLVVDPNGGMYIEELHPGAAAEAYDAIGVALAGTDVTAALESGTLDFSEGMPSTQDTEFRHVWCPTFWDLFFACGGGLASCLAAAPTIAGLAYCGIAGGYCGYVAAHYVDFC